MKAHSSAIINATPAYTKARAPYVAAAWPINAFHLNQRLRIQQGAFLIPGDISKPFMTNLEALPGHDSKDNLLKIVIVRERRVAFAICFRWAFRARASSQVSTASRSRCRSIRTLETHVVVNYRHDSFSTCSDDRGGASRDRRGTPSERAVMKVRTRLDDESRQFVSLSPFLLISTSGADGTCDVSPKGDAPGFVHVLDESRIVIPERNGNKRLDGMKNLLANPHIGLLFLVPGRDYTLRVNGRACITRDPALLECRPRKA